jgi:hypothetical protein
MRATSIIMVASYMALFPLVGYVHATQIVAAFVVVISVLSLRIMRETYGVNLDYIEK